jgi:hypothetical protein
MHSRRFVCEWKLFSLPSRKKSTESLLHTQERDGTIIQKNHFPFPVHVNGIFVIIPYFPLTLALSSRCTSLLFNHRPHTSVICGGEKRELCEFPSFWLVIKYICCFLALRLEMLFLELSQYTFVYTFTFQLWHRLMARRRKHFRVKFMISVNYVLFFIMCVYVYAPYCYEA